MRERDNGNTERFAVFIPVAMGRGNGNIYIESLGIASDRESAEQAAIEMSDRSGAQSWTLEELKPSGLRGEKKYYFSGATWKAPWQPTGHKPNWRTEENSSEPIN